MLSANRIVDIVGYQGLRVYVGDLHNHCGISYGHGPIEDAFANARLQLDFGTVTGHAWWHDMPSDRPDMAAAVAYHREGFERLADCWDHVQDVTEAVHCDGEFVSFLSFEWHSSRFGDHCVYYKGDHGKIIRADDLDDLRTELRRFRGAGIETMALPHHIGYPTGHRGANWSTFAPEFTPVVEIMSMHGCGESDGAPRPYLHTMGPRHSANTAVAALRRGHRFGLIGSTDHHSAHPGSFGHGRAAVWASELTRDGIWDAIAARRTYALTGDPIVVGFTVDDVPMGGVAASTGKPTIRAEVRAEAPIDYIEVLRNGTLLHRTSPGGSGRTPEFRGVVPIAVGWGRLGEDVGWDVRIRVENGRLTDVAPRLRGEDIVVPTADAPSVYQFSDWGRDGPNEVWLRTRTHGNANVVTDGTQGLNLHLEGDDRTTIAATVNGRQTVHTIGALRNGSDDCYLEPVVSPVYRFGPAVDHDQLVATMDFTDDASDLDHSGDWYHLRVRQTNDQWAWTSPVWVDRSPRA